MSGKQTHSQHNITHGLAARQLCGSFWAVGWTAGWVRHCVRGSEVSADVQLELSYGAQWRERGCVCNVG